MTTQTNPRTISPAVRALCERMIDYAGMYPPAAVSREQAVANYKSYQQGLHAWMLRYLVVGAAELANIPAELDGAISLLAEADNPRAAAIETKSIVRAPRPVYCEVPIAQLHAVKSAGCFAKFRAGGVKPDAIPPVNDVASFILACAERRLAFKVTAGLHHCIRAEYPLTYETDAPRSVMHGFLNVFLAAAFAWHGRRDIESILSETDIKTFKFDDGIHWRNASLTAAQIRDARQNFIHSVGSCSFTEPLDDLIGLGLIPSSGTPGEG